MNIKTLIEKASKLDIINSNIINEIQYYPQINKNIAYIVGIVLLNEKNQICLIQEAKLTCYKRWYLPAGRVEPNETLNQAAIREAKEETGYSILPLRLFNIELGSTGNWYRFSFIARIEGGSLKTKPDKESLRADWFNLSDLSDIDLRSNDFIKLVDLGVRLYNMYGINSFNLNESNYLSLKDRFIISNDISKDLVVYGFVLLSETLDSFLFNKAQSFPGYIITSYLNYKYNLDYVTKNILFQECFKSLSTNINYKYLGIMSVSFSAQNNATQHGIEIVFVLNILNEQIYELNESYSWLKLDNQFDKNNLINLMIN